MPTDGEAIPRMPCHFDTGNTTDDDPIVNTHVLGNLSVELPRDPWE
jgi:hypothetical protein